MMAIERPFDLLDDYSLLDVLSKLPLLERLRVQRTCSRFKFAVDSLLKSQKKLIVNRNSASFGANKGKKRWDRDQEAIQLGSAQYSASSVLADFFPKCPNLQQLELRAFTHIDDQTVETICQKAPQLQYISLVFPLGLSSGLLKRFSLNFSGLNLLGLQFCDLMESDLRGVLKECQRLQSLDITGNDAVTGDCFSLFGPRIEALHVSRCLRVSVPGLRSLTKGHAKGLKTVDMDCFGNSEEMTERLEMICFNLHSLENIRLRTSYLSPEYDILSLGRLGSLQSIDIIEFGPMVSDQGLINIMDKCKRLKHLKVDLCAGRSDLSLDGIQVTDRSLSKINSLSPVIESIFLAHASKLTEATFASMARLPNLKKVTFKGLPITNEAAIHLLNCSLNLKRIKFVYCKLITGAVIEAAIRLSQSRPRTWLSLTLGECCLNYTPEDNIPRNLDLRVTDSGRSGWLSR